MHVVQALAALSVGGSELVTAEIAACLVEAGHRATVVGAAGPLSERVSNSGAQLLDWPIGRKRPRTYGFVKRLAAWLNQQQPDIVHAHSRLPAWVCHLALRRLAPDKRPVFITSVHGQYTVSPYSAIMARGDHVIAVSQHILDYTLSNYAFVDQNRISVIPGGISKRVFARGYAADPSWFEAVRAEFPELEGKRLLLLPARLSRYKGHAAFIEMIASLAADFPDIHGLIIGPGRPGSRYRAELEGLAERNDVFDRVTFTGLRTDMREWMSASEIVFNLCSDPPEAFGRTVPEALHLGVPVIAWNHGGVRETLSIMFPQGAVSPNAQSALVEKTRSFLLNRPQVPESDAFRLAQSMDETLRLYERVLKE